MHKQQTVIKIHLGFGSDAIGDLPDPGDQAHSYAAALRAALERAYPDADITIDWNLSQSGAVAAGDRAMIYTDAEGWDESAALDELIQETWGAWFEAAWERPYTLRDLAELVQRRERDLAPGSETSILADMVGDYTYPQRIIAGETSGTINDPDSDATEAYHLYARAYDRLEQWEADGSEYEESDLWA